MARQITPRQRSYILGLARRRRIAPALALRLAAAHKGDLSTEEASRLIADLNSAPRLRRRKGRRRTAKETLDS